MYVRGSCENHTTLLHDILLLYLFFLYDFDIFQSHVLFSAIHQSYTCTPLEDQGVCPDVVLFLKIYIGTHEKQTDSMCRQSYVPGGLSLIYVNYFTFSYNYLCITAKSILLDILTNFFCLCYRQTQCQHGKYFN